ncbi:universal stress protein [Limibacillus halophilus]|jgi:nucleotide-binding universal stress UspA family protein
MTDIGLTLPPLPPAPETPRVFLVVVDDSQEMQLALFYACLRARRTGGRVALLQVLEPSEFQHWMSVGDLMREEARQEAEMRLQKLAGQVNEILGAYPILYLREGNRRDELLALIEEDPSISILVLGANTSGGGPGPLVSALTGKFLSNMRIPMTLVPDNLTEEQLAEIA